MATVAERLTRTWEGPNTAVGWLSTVDHKKIGRRYVTTAFIFFILAGVNALAMRAQLALPQNDLIGPETYNQLFTMHGTTMIFLFSTPILFGFGNFMVPLMLGSRDMAFPRLNAFGYWVFLFSGTLLYSSFLTWSAPDAGWFNYVPLSGPAASTGHNIDFYVVGLVFLAIATTAGAINFIVTIFKLRAPGMTMARIPLFIWSILVTSFAVVFAVPALTAANVLLYMDRHHGTDFFNPAQGGDPLLWQHLFWIFGHPDVYIIFLPAVGIVSSIVPTFARHRMVGHSLVVLATLATGIISFGVWVHHMFAVGLPGLSNAFFAAASTLIAIPAGIQIFAWLATVWRGNVVWKSPFKFIFGFFALFIIGGVTGVMFAAVPFDRQVTDSYFVVAHFHYVLFGGAVFPIFGGLHYWWPKMTGRLLDERAASLTFWLMFIGFNVTFFPMHIVGLLGMPRRVSTYLPGLGWDALNMIESAGAVVIALSVLVFLVNAAWSLQAGEVAGDDPWGGGTLEWATSSPPAAYNFVRIPVVGSLEPLWDRHAAGPDALALDAGRETAGTTLMDARLSRILKMPGDSIWPLVMAVGLLVLFSALIVDGFIVMGVGGAIALIALAGWFWPSERISSGGVA